MLLGKALESDYIFVFGSNKAGIHGAGAALTARRLYGAQYGNGFGLQGRSYAIPTKDWDVATPLKLDQIRMFVQEFISFAEQHPEQTFKVTRIGCGRAGYKNEEVAPIFALAPSNVKLPTEWRDYLGVDRAPGSFWSR